MNRRKFFKTTTISTAGLSLVPKEIFLANRKMGRTYFGVHSFVENNPEAVFIMRTDVDKKTNSAKIYETGTAFAKSVLVSKEEGELGAVPIINLIAIKPNLTTRNNFNRTLLKTQYLQKDYDGQNEYLWHLCDEDYDYKPNSLDSEKSELSSAYSFEQNYPNTFYPSTN